MVGQARAFPIPNEVDDRFAGIVMRCWMLRRVLFCIELHVFGAASGLNGGDGRLIWREGGGS
jgi:hypothetical protein